MVGTDVVLVEFFDTQEEEDEHKAHKHWYCPKHKRFFKNENALRQHLRSEPHRDRNVRCPGSGCAKAFIDHAYLFLHFETGTCPSGITRADVDECAVEVDTHSVATDPGRLVRHPDGSYAKPATPRYAIPPAGAPYACPVCAQTFGSRGRLRAHLKSPVHDARIYRCPAAVAGECKGRFSTFSALLQHAVGRGCGLSRSQKSRLWRVMYKVMGCCVDRHVSVYIL